MSYIENISKNENNSVNCINILRNNTNTSNNISYTNYPNNKNKSKNVSDNCKIKYKNILLNSTVSDNKISIQNNIIKTVDEKKDSNDKNEESITLVQENAFLNVNEILNKTFINEKEDSLLNNKNIIVNSEFKFSKTNIFSGEKDKEEKRDTSIKWKNNDNLNENKIVLNKKGCKNDLDYSIIFMNHLKESSEEINKKKNDNFDLNIENCNSCIMHSEHNQSDDNINLCFDKKKKTKDTAKNANNATEKSKMNTLNFCSNDYFSSDKKKKIDNFSFIPNENTNISLMQNKKQGHNSTSKEDNFDKLNEKKNNEILNSSINMLNDQIANNKENNMNFGKSCTNIFYHENEGNLTDNTKKKEFSIYNNVNNTLIDSERKQTILSNKETYINKNMDNVCINKFNTTHNNEKNSNNNANYNTHNDKRKNNIINNINNYIMVINRYNNINNFVDVKNQNSVNNINDTNDLNHCTDNVMIHNEIELKLNNDNKSSNKYLKNDYDSMHYINFDKDIHYNNMEEKNSFHSSLNSKQNNFEDTHVMCNNFNDITSYKKYNNNTMKNYFYTSQIGNHMKIKNPIIENGSNHNDIKDINNNINNFDNNTSHILDIFSNNTETSKNFESTNDNLEKKNIEHNKYNCVFKKCTNNIIKNDNLINDTSNLNDDKNIYDITRGMSNINENGNINYIHEKLYVKNISNVEEIDVMGDLYKNNNVNEINCINNMKDNNLNCVNKTNYTNNLNYIKDNNIDEINNEDNVVNGSNGLNTLNGLEGAKNIRYINNNCIKNINYIDNINIINNMDDDYMNNGSFNDKTNKMNDKSANKMSDDTKNEDIENIFNVNMNTISYNCVNFSDNIFQDMKCENDDNNISKSLVKGNEFFNNHTEWLKFFSEKRNKIDYDENININESYDKRINCLNISNNENMKSLNNCNNLKLGYGNNDFFLNNWNNNVNEMDNNKKEFIIKDINNENVPNLNLKKDITNEVESQNENENSKNNNIKTDSNISIDICEEKNFIKKEKDHKTNNFNEIDTVHKSLDKKEESFQMNEVHFVIDNTNNMINNENISKEKNICNENFNFYINNNTKNRETENSEKLEDLHKWLSKNNIFEQNLYFNEEYSSQEAEMEFKKMSKEIINKNSGEHINNIINLKCDTNKYSMNKNVETKEVNKYFYSTDNSNNNNCTDNNNNNNINNHCNSNDMNNINICDNNVNNSNSNNRSNDKECNNKNRNIDINRNGNNKNNNINNSYSIINNIDINNSKNDSNGDKSDKKVMQNNNNIDNINNNEYSTVKINKESTKINFSVNSNFNNIKKVCTNMQTNNNFLINNGNSYYNNLSNIHISSNENINCNEKTNKPSREDDLSNTCASYDKLKEEVNALYCDENVEKKYVNSNMSTDYIINEKKEENKIKSEGINYDLKNNFKWNYLELNYPKHINFNKAFFFSFQNDIYIYGAKQNNFIIPDKIFKVNKNQIETICTKGTQPQIYFKIYFLCDIGDGSLLDYKSSKSYMNDNLYKFNRDEEKEEKNNYENSLLNPIHKNTSFLFSDKKNCNKDNNLHNNLIKGINNEYNKEKKHFYILGCKEQRIVDFYTIYKLDMNNFQWEEIKITYNRLLNLSREDFSIILINDYLYLFGGVILSDDTWVSCNEFWKCNIKKRKWKLIKLNKKKKKEVDLYYNFNTSNPLKYLINLKKPNEDHIDNNNQTEIENENNERMENENKNNSSSIFSDENYIERWPSSRACHLCVCYKNKIFIHGGTDLMEEKDDFYFFDLEKKKWYEILCHSHNYPSKRYGHSGLFINNKLYMYGGFTKYLNCSILNNDFFEYDFEKNSWKQIFTIDDLLYLKIDLIKEKKNYLQFLQLLILKNFFKNQLVNHLNLNTDKYDTHAIKNETNNKEDISNNDNSNDHKIKLNTCLGDDDKIKDETTKKESAKVINEKDSCEKNCFENYSSKNEIIIKHNNPFLEEVPTTNTIFNNSLLSSDYLFTSHSYKSKECYIFLKKNKIQRNLYGNFMCIKEMGFWKSIVIPYNNFRNNCFYFNNSLYFFGGCGLNNSSPKNVFNSFIYHDNIFKIQIEKSYIDFILHYLFYINDFFFEFIENIKNDVLQNLRTDKKGDIDIGNYQIKKDNNTYDEICMNIKIIDDELQNRYMNTQEKEGEKNKINEKNFCKNEIMEQNDIEIKKYAEDKNIQKLENQKLGNMFLSVQNKKTYELLIFLYDLYENIYSKNMKIEKSHVQNDNINDHRKNNFYKDLYEKTSVERNSYNNNHNDSFDMFTEKKRDIETIINNGILSEEIEKNRSLFFQTNKTDDQDKNTFQRTTDLEIENYNKIENFFENIYDDNGLQYSNEIKIYQNENKKDDAHANGVLNNVDNNNQNIDLNINNSTVYDNVNYYENYRENRNENFNVISNENYKTNYNEIHNKPYMDSYNINGYDKNYNGNYNQYFNKSYYECNSEILYTNNLSLSNSVTKNNIIINNYDNINLNYETKEISNFNEDMNFGSSEMKNICNNSNCNNMNKTMVWGYNKKNYNYDEENISTNNFTSYYNNSNIENRRMFNEQNNCEDFYNSYESNENNYIIQKYINNNQINLNIDKSIIYNYLENFQELNDEKYAIKMKIKRNDIYKLIYTYTKNVEIENNIYFSKIEKLEAQIKELLEEKNPINKINKTKEEKSEEYLFNEVQFEKLKNDATYMKKKLNYFNDIINIYSVKLQKQNLYIKILENKYEYLMNYLLKLKSILFKESINNDIYKFFYEDNFFIHEKNNTCNENNKNVTISNNKIKDHTNFNDVDYISHI